MSVVCLAHEMAGLILQLFIKCDELARLYMSGIHRQFPIPRRSMSRINPQWHEDSPWILALGRFYWMNGTKLKTGVE